MQPFSVEGSARPAPQDASRQTDSRAPDRAAPCNDPDLRQAIHRLRLTLDSLPE